MVEEKQLSREVVTKALESAMVSAYRKAVTASAAQHVEAVLNLEEGKFQIYAEKEVVDSVVDDRTEVSLETARQFNPAAEYGDLVIVESTPEDFGRIAAQTRLYDGRSPPPQSRGAGNRDVRRLSRPAGLRGAKPVCHAEGNGHSHAGDSARLSLAGSRSGRGALNSEIRPAGTVVWRGFKRDARGFGCPVGFVVSLTCGLDDRPFFLFLFFVLYLKEVEVEEVMFRAKNAHVHQS